MTDRMLSRGPIELQGHAEKSAVVARRPSGDLRGSATNRTWGRAEAGKPCESRSRWHLLGSAGRTADFAPKGCSAKRDHGRLGSESEGIGSLTDSIQADMPVNRRWKMETGPTGVARLSQMSETKVGGHDHKSVETGRKSATANDAHRRRIVEPSCSADDLSSALIGTQRGTTRVQIGPAWALLRAVRRAQRNPSRKFGAENKARTFGKLPVVRAHLKDPAAMSILFGEGA